MDAEAIIELATAAATILTRVQAARATLSADDQAKVDAAITTLFAEIDTDFARVDAELAAAG